jgi:hypothetical protein
MFLNAYLICLRFTRGSPIERTIQVEISVSGRVQSGAVSPRTIQLGGTASDVKIPLPLMSKEDRFIRCIAQRYGSRGSDGHRGSMSDITSVLRHSVSINAKWGDC